MSNPVCATSNVRSLKQAVINITRLRLHWIDLYLRGCSHMCWPASPGLAVEANSRKPLSEQKQLDPAHISRVCKNLSDCNMQIN